MDRNGWTKTKLGRRIYQDKPHPFSTKDILRITEKTYIEPEEADDLFDLLAKIFEEIIVRRFSSLPLVNEAWEYIRDYTRQEHRQGRPMTLYEQWHFLLERVIDRNKDVSASFENKVISNELDRIIKDLQGIRKNKLTVKVIKEEKDTSNSTKNQSVEG